MIVDPTATITDLELNCADNAPLHNTKLKNKATPVVIEKTLALENWLCLEKGGGASSKVKDAQQEVPEHRYDRFGKYELKYDFSKATITRAICRPDSFVLVLCYCANLKAIRYESTSQVKSSQKFIRHYSKIVRVLA